MPVELTVVGSINLDLVARVERLPRAGETLSGSDLVRIPGGKGANQAVAAARIGATVRMVGAVARGENQIVVVPGANGALTPRAVEGAVPPPARGFRRRRPGGGAFGVVLRAQRGACPADRLEPDLLVVNELEYEVVSRGKLVAVTYGAEGAALFENGREIARAMPPHVKVRGRHRRR
jgi:ribokinase